MASSKKKPPPSDFDFEGFFKSGPDSGMETAVAAMLRRSELDDVGLNLTPDVSLMTRVLPFPPSTTEIDNAEAIVNLRPGLKLTPEGTLEPAPTLLPAPNLNMEVGFDRAAGEDILRAGGNLRPASSLLPAGLLKRTFPIRHMKLAQDAHSRAEQAVYKSLWETAQTLDDLSRVITIGFGEMARLVGLSESNARINTRALIGKLAIEERGGFDCERSIGRTYRVFNYPEILRRRKEAGLTRYQRRTLAVVFVDENDQPLDLTRKHSIPGINLTAAPGINLGRDSGIKLRPDPGTNLDEPPGINLEPLNREQHRETASKETSSSDALIRQALANYGTPDENAIARLQADIKSICPDASVHEVLHFIAAKGALIRSRNSKIENPIGFLVASVPKCFEGESFYRFRQAHLRLTQQGRESTFHEAGQTERYQAILNDPNASEMEKRLASAVLAKA